MVPIVTRAQNSSGLTEVEGGDFETPVYSSAPFYAFAPVGDARWTWSGAAGVQRNGSGLGTDAPKGVQTAFLRSANGAPSRFSSQVLLDAGTYRVRFKAAQRLNSGGVPIQIKLDNTSVGAPIMPTNTAFEIYKSVPFQVSADGSTYRLEFGTDSTGGNAMSLIDAILIEAVPSATLNGGFEAPVTDIAPFYVFGPSGSGWTWSGTAGIQRNGSGLGADAPAGVQTALVRGGTNPGAFSQSVSLGAGNSYRVKFRMAQRGTGNGVPIQVKVDGAAIGAPIVPSSTAFAACATVPFMASAGSNVIQFATDSGNSNWMSLIDEVTIEDATTVALPTPLAPFAPKALTVTTATGRANLTWRTVDGASGYRVKRAQVAGGPYTTLSATATTNSFTDSPLSNGTTYYYRVFAFNGAGSGADSREVSATPLSAPVVTVVSGIKRIDLNWSAVAGATSYKVFVTAPAASGPMVEVPVSGTSASHVGLSSGTTYGYNVVAYAADGSSDATAVSVITLPDAPQNLYLGVNSSSQITLSWSDVFSATKYRLKRSADNGGPYTTLPNVITGTNFTDSNLSANTVYYYRVVAVNAGGDGPDSAQRSGRTFDNAPTSAPVLTATGSSSTPTSGSANLNWSAVDRATSYEIRRRVGGPGNNFVNVAYTANTSYVDSGLTYGVTYTYTVQASNNGGASLATVSNEVDITVSQAAPTATPMPVPTATPMPGPTATPVPPPPPPTPTATPVPPPIRPATPINVVAVAGDASVSLSWNAVSGATSYRVKRGTTTGGPYATLSPVVSTTSFTDSGLSNGMTYYYRVYAVNSAGNSDDSTQVQATPTAPVPPPLAPTNLVATAGNTQITLVWNAVSGAASYKIKRSTTNGGPYTTLAPSVTATTYTDTGLSNGTPYYYRVYAVNASGNGPDSEQAQATPVPPPTSPTRGVDLSIEAMDSNSTQGEVGANDYYPEVTQEATYSIPNRTTATFRLKVYNKGTVSDNIRLGGRGDTPGWRVSYFDSAMPTGGADISAAVKSNTHIVGIPASGFHVYRVELKPGATAKVDEAKSVAITAYSENDSGALDQVVATAVPTSPPLPSYRPDSLVRVAGQTDYRGDGIYDFMASDEQTVSSTASSGVVAVYNLKIINKGNVADKFKFKLPLAKQGWALSLYDALSGGTDITSTAQQTFGFTTQSLAPDQFKEFRLEVKPNAGTTGSFPVSIVTTSFTDSAAQDVGVFDTTVGNVSTNAAVNFIGSRRACAGGIDNALHKLTLTLRATNNGAPLPNAPIALSFENNVGHNYGTREAPNIPRKAKIYDPNDPVVTNRWKESVTLSTNGNGDVQVIVLSSDVISQPRLVARWQNAIVGGLACDFAAATSRRGVFDPADPADPDWQANDTGWSVNLGEIEQSGQTCNGQFSLQFDNPVGSWQSAPGHLVKIGIAKLVLSNGAEVYDRSEISRYLRFIQGATEVDTLTATTIANGKIEFVLKAMNEFDSIRGIAFDAQGQTQWAQ